MTNGLWAGERKSFPHPLLWVYFLSLRNKRLIKEGGEKDETNRLQAARDVTIPTLDCEPDVGQGPVNVWCLSLAWRRFVSFFLVFCPLFPPLFSFHSRGCNVNERIENRGGKILGLAATSVLCFLFWHLSFYLVFYFILRRSREKTKQEKERSAKIKKTRAAAPFAAGLFPHRSHFFGAKIWFAPSTLFFFLLLKMSVDKRNRAVGKDRGQ